MADINVEKRSEGRDLERRSEGRGLFRRGERGVFSLFNRHPEDLFAMSPFTLMRRLTEDMDRMFSGYGGSAQSAGEWAPAIEVREQDGNLVVNADLPGLNKEDVKVELNDEGLVIRGERKREWEEDKGGMHRSERSYGSFYRVIPLPENVKAEHAKAEFRNGVLEVRVPIPEGQRKSRQIPIESGGERKPLSAETSKPATQTSKAG